MKDKDYRVFDYVNAISEKTHPQPDDKTVFFDKHKPELSLKNPGVIYRKHREKLLKKSDNQ